jgi:hypothetical protein
MTFWLIYAIAIHAAGIAFVASLFAYLRGRQERPSPLRVNDGDLDVEGELLALYAQYQLAPSLALFEVRERLGLGPPAPDAATEEDFLDLLQRLERSGRHGVSPAP